MRVAYAVPGSTTKVKTGEWRSTKPIVDANKCVKCGICQNYCPEGIMGTPGKVPEIDYDYCKGCGLCAVECPVKAIAMERDIKKVAPDAAAAGK
jgi:2-oxoacid:acceptor oxidoreductase delta subunit (pyruvate/2-ketoisovalerate family)